ncbi:MAG: glycosyltransferase family 4 protein [bacterium]
MLVMILTALATLVISLICTALVRRLAIRFKIFDTPNYRTIHQALIPKLGGLSIFVAFSLGLSIFSFATKFNGNLWGLLIGGGLVSLVGFLDDIYILGCYRKLIGQAVATGFAIYFGFSFHAISLPFGITVELGILGIPLSMLWILAITNGVNLLDGLDGLAAGFSILVALFILIGAEFSQNITLAAGALIFIAASLGFLKFNFPPAKIFMGDMGSLFLGYFLACLSIKAFTFPSLGPQFGVLLILFSVPLADTSLAILRRLRLGKHPFFADKKHIHHRLLEMGFNQLYAVLTIYAVTFVCGIIGLVLLVSNFNQSF